MSLRIDQIRIDGGTQSRAAINAATVDDYAESMADPNTVFPPVTVYFDGKDYWLADGFHRLAAWAKIGRTDIPAEIRQGDRRRAILHSVAANAAHGLRRTNEDKRRAVLTLLEDPEWSQWSNREIARRCAVSDHLVADVRASLTAFSRSDDAGESRTYTTKHGTQATMNTANIGGGSRVDHETKPQQALAGEAERRASQRDASNNDQEPADAPADPEEPLDPEVEKVMRKHAGLTREALLRDYAELVVASKAERAALKSEIEGLKATIASFEAEGESGRKLGIALRENKTLQGRLSEYMQIAKREEYKRKKAEARVAELERMEIAL